MSDLADCSVVLLTAGVNEKAGGAMDRRDTEGRLRLLRANAGIFRDLVPRIVEAAPHAIILVVTDPPDPLTDLTRSLAGHDCVFGSGTFLDSLRFQTHLGRKLGVAASAVDAWVVGEHGTSSVFLWSSAQIAGGLVGGRFGNADQLKDQVEREVRQANINIIEGIGASQYGIGIASARIVEAILRDSKIVIPVSSWHSGFGVSLSMPSVIGASGIERTIRPDLSTAEEAALRASAHHIASAAAQLEH